jgi:hypothetical protein
MQYYLKKYNTVIFLYTMHNRLPVGYEPIFESCAYPIPMHPLHHMQPVQPNSTHVNQNTLSCIRNKHTLQYSYCYRTFRSSPLYTSDRSPKYSHASNEPITTGSATQCDGDFVVFCAKKLLYRFNPLGLPLLPLLALMSPFEPHDPN